MASDDLSTQQSPQVRAPETKMLGFGFGPAELSARRRGGASAYSPAALFTGGAQGAWFDPSDLSTLWQDAAGTIAVTQDGDPVGRIDDKSGNGQHAVQAAAAARPLWRTAGGISWLEFDGADDFLDLPAWDAVLWGTSGTVALGLMPGTSSGLRTLVWTHGNGTILKRKGDGQLNFYTGSVYQDTAAGTLPPSQSTVITRTAGETGGEPMRLFVDGVEVATEVSAINYGSPGYKIGASYNATAQFFDGRLYGLVLVNAILEGAARGAAEGWLAARSGL